MITKKVSLLMISAMVSALIFVAYSAASVNLGKQIIEARQNGVVTVPAAGQAAKSFPKEITYTNSTLGFVNYRVDDQGFNPSVVDWEMNMKPLVRIRVYAPNGSEIMGKLTVASQVLKIEELPEAIRPSAKEYSGQYKQAILVWKRTGSRTPPQGQYKAVVAWNDSREKIDEWSFSVQSKQHKKKQDKITRKREEKTQSGTAPKESKENKDSSSEKHRDWGPSIRFKYEIRGFWGSGSSHFGYARTLAKARKMAIHVSQSKKKRVAIRSTKDYDKIFEVVNGNSYDEIRYGIYEGYGAYRELREYGGILPYGHMDNLLDMAYTFPEAWKIAKSETDKRKNDKIKPEIYIFSFKTEEILYKFKYDSERKRVSASRYLVDDNMEYRIYEIYSDGTKSFFAEARTLEAAQKLAELAAQQSERKFNIQSIKTSEIVGTVKDYIHDKLKYGIYEQGNYDDKNFLNTAHTLDEAREIAEYESQRSKDKVVIWLFPPRAEYAGKTVDVIEYDPEKDKFLSSFDQMFGEVEVHFPWDPQNKWRLADLDTKLPAGSRIRTGDGDFALIKYGNQSTFVLKPKSEIVLVKAYSKGTDFEISIFSGDVWAKFHKTKDNRLKINTPESIMTIRGTTFVVSQDNDASTLKVIDGVVELKTKADGSTTNVRTGEMVSVTKTGLGKKTNFNVSAEQKSWKKLPNR